ncbi:MAG: hypothetical protein IJ093_03015 [Bacilli bacterium]|nr:hypothetical protein [Bacilli bacterium]
MEYILTFVFCFVVIYFVYYIVVVSRDKGIEAFKKGKQITFFKNVYKLDLKKLNYKKFANSLSLTNSFIMALVITIVEVFDSLIIKLLVAFILIIPLILICYYILGKLYKKKEGK